jgi:hypothetical protein
LSGLAKSVPESFDCAVAPDVDGFGRTTQDMPDVFVWKLFPIREEKHLAVLVAQRRKRSKQLFLLHGADGLGSRVLGWVCGFGGDLAPQPGATGISPAMIRENIARDPIQPRQRRVAFRDPAQLAPRYKEDILCRVERVRLIWQSTREICHQRTVMAIKQIAEPVFIF